MSPPTSPFFFFTAGPPNLFGFGQETNFCFPPTPGRFLALGKPPPARTCFLIDVKPSFFAPTPFHPPRACKSGFPLQGRCFFAIFYPSLPRFVTPMRSSTCSPLGSFNVHGDWTSRRIAHWLSPRLPFFPFFFFW